MNDQSVEIGELAAALAKAQGEIKTAGRTAQNPFFHSNYADLAAIREACADALSKNGIAYTQVVNFEADSRWLETTLMHSSGQWMRGKYPLRPIKDDPQSLGSAITYAKRYALAAFVGVVSVDEDDDGEAASGRGNGKSAEPPTAPNRKALATKWANDALQTIQSFKTAEELSAWHKTHANTVAALRGFNETLHGKLTDAIRTRSADLSTLGAG